jgi:hypothetical protein
MQTNAVYGRAARCPEPATSARLGAVLVFFFFLRADRERELLASYATEDAAG